MLHDFLGRTPQIQQAGFIAPSADVIGDVALGANASIWFNATVRGDVNWIRIGEESNIQDNAVVHVTNGTSPTFIGARVTVGHSATVHGCTIKDRVLIGMGAVIMDDAVIGSDSIVGARALVTAGTEIPPRSLVLGAPGRVVRQLTDEEVARVKSYADHYVEYSRHYTQNKESDGHPYYSPDEAPEPASL